MYVGQQRVLGVDEQVCAREEEGGGEKRKKETREAAASRKRSYPFDDEEEEEEEVGLLFITMELTIQAKPSTRKKVNE